MKRWVRAASYFYPATWRRRYAMEFDAMLDQVDAGWKDVFDILKGALTMQFTSWNFKSILLTFGVIGAVIAAAAAVRIPDQYQSMSVMRLSPQSPTHEGWHPEEAAAYINEVELGGLSRTSLEAIITGFDLYRSQRKERPLEDVVQDMRNHDIAIKMMSPVGGRQDDRTFFSIAYAYPDAKLAQAVTRELVTRFTEQNVTVAHGGIRNGENMAVIDPPSDPMRPIYPNRALFAITGLFLGLFAGLLAGLTVAYALRWRIAIVRRSA